MKIVIKKQRIFINAVNLKPGIYTIGGVEPSEFGSGYCLVLVGEGEQEYALTLNQTNLQVLADKLGDETDNWLLHTVELYRSNVYYMGKSVPGVRLRVVEDVSF